MGIKQVTAARQTLEIFTMYAAEAGLPGYEQGANWRMVGFDKVEWKSVGRPRQPLDIRVNDIKNEDGLVSANAVILKEGNEEASNITGLKIKAI